MSEIALLTGVSRLTVYLWLQGEESSVETRSNLERLFNVFEQIQELKIPHVSQLLHRPILDGQSLFDIFRGNKDTSDFLIILKNLAEKEKLNRSQAKGSGKNLRSLDEVAYD